jgi:hypothetical protein
MLEFCISNGFLNAFPSAVSNIMIDSVKVITINTIAKMFKNL